LGGVKMKFVRRITKTLHGYKVELTNGYVWYLEDLEVLLK